MPGMFLKVGGELNTKKKGKGHYDKANHSKQAYDFSPMFNNKTEYCIHIIYTPILNFYIICAGTQLPPAACKLCAV